MKKHFVIFYSPGSFVAETNTIEISTWCILEAVKMARDIHQRYNARPYGFVFTTRTRGENDLDSKESARSNVYYLGGEIKTLKEVEAENNPKNDILISNMRSNEYEKVIINHNSWRWTQPLAKKDIVLGLDYLPPGMSFFDYVSTMANNYQEVVRRGVALLAI
jgi:hypothetical protein